MEFEFSCGSRYLWTALEVDAVTETSLVEGGILQRAVSVANALCMHHIKSLQYFNLLFLVFILIKSCNLIRLDFVQEILTVANLSNSARWAGLARVDRPMNSESTSLLEHAHLGWIQLEF